MTSSLSAAILCAFSDADVVHIHAEGPAFMCWLPRLFGKRVIVTVHGLDWQREKWKRGFASKYIHAGEKVAVKLAHEIIVLSQNTKDYFMDTYGRETVFIPNGVNRPEIRPAQQITEAFGLQKDGYFLFLGRLVPEKGVHYLVDAFLRTNTDKKLVIAGGSSDTDSFRPFSAKASVCPASNRILFPQASIYRLKPCSAVRSSRQLEFSIRVHSFIEYPPFLLLLYHSPRSAARKAWRRLSSVLY